MWGILQGVLFFLFALALWAAPGLFIGRLAEKRKRSPRAWFWLAILLGPTMCFYYLTLSGVPRSVIRREEREKRLRERHPDEEDIQKIVEAEFECSNCGAALNYATGHGYHSPHGEPWKIVCNECDTEVEAPV